jgi:hypothetical protein
MACISASTSSAVFNGGKLQATPASRRAERTMSKHSRIAVRLPCLPISPAFFTIAVRSSALRLSTRIFDLLRAPGRRPAGFPLIPF